MEAGALLWGVIALNALVLLAVLWLSPGRGESAAALLARLDALSRDQERLERLLSEGQRGQRDEQGAALMAQRLEIAEGLSNLTGAQKAASDSVSTQLSSMARILGDGNESFARQMGEAQKNAHLQMEALRQKVEQELDALRADNAEKLEKMRETVDEKLQGALRERLGESFRLVSDRLEQVHRGLGEMQSLASGVGDLKKIMGNVKTRGVWGEIQLGALLDQILSPEQYIANAQCRAETQERVEFAVRLPGRGEGGDEVWLPIDAKFPREDFERLIDASERGDQAGAETASKALEARVKSFARDISAKYVNPPRTTDFAILFVPAEGLYAELLRRPDLAFILQRDYRVTLAGPTVLGALLNSLQMGFRTLAIEKGAGEAWELLSAVKTEFGKYGEVLGRLRQKLKEASDQVDQVASRKRAIERRLRDVEEAGGARNVLLSPPAEDEAD